MNEEQPTFGPKDIGEGGEKGYPSVLGVPTDAQPTPLAEDESTPDITPSVDPDGVEQDVLNESGSEIEIKPVGTEKTRDPQPGEIGYSEDTGNDSVITRE